jgi:hypothetical protein
VFHAAALLIAIASSAVASTAGAQTVAAPAATPGQDWRQQFRQVTLGVAIAVGRVSGAVDRAGAGLIPGSAFRPVG